MNYNEASARFFSQVARMGRFFNYFAHMLNRNHVFAFSVSHFVLVFQWHWMLDNLVLSVFVSDYFLQMALLRKQQQVAVLEHWSLTAEVMFIEQKY